MLIVFLCMVGFFSLGITGYAVNNTGNSSPTTNIPNDKLPKDVKVHSKGEEVSEIAKTYPKTGERKTGAMTSIAGGIIIISVGTFALSKARKSQ